LNGAASTLMVYPSLDAIQEVKVLTSNYGAQYGRTASGTVQVTTKSGTPKWHGNLYDFIRNEAFNSRNYFDIVYTEPPLPGQTTPGKTSETRLRFIGGRILGARSAARSIFPVFQHQKGQDLFLLLRRIPPGENARQSTTRPCRD
jgi:hypothetical protein